MVFEHYPTTNLDLYSSCYFIGNSVGIRGLLDIVKAAVRKERIENPEPALQQLLLRRSRYDRPYQSDPVSTSTPSLQHQFPRFQNYAQMQGIFPPIRAPLNELAHHAYKLQLELRAVLFSGVPLRLSQYEGKMYLTLGAETVLQFDQVLSQFRLARLCLVFAAGDLDRFTTNFLAVSSSPGFSNDLRFSDYDGSVYLKTDYD